MAAEFGYLDVVKLLLDQGAGFNQGKQVCLFVCLFVCVRAQGIHVCVRVCTCVRACMHACVRACVSACVPDPAPCPLCLCMFVVSGGYWACCFSLARTRKLTCPPVARATLECHTRPALAPLALPAAGWALWVGDTAENGGVCP